MSAKFPRIPHLPFSPGATPDDEHLLDVKGLLNEPLVLTEKMDGANVCLTRDTVYARSHSGPATGRMFDELKAHHAMVRHLIPEDTSVFAEWCKAVHSIEYTAENFPRLFVMAVRNDKFDLWLDWEQSHYWAGRLGAVAVPKVTLDRFDDERDLEFAVKDAAASVSEYGPSREGIVVRHVGAIWNDQFGKRIAKYVREGFTSGEKLSAGDLLWQPGRIPG